MARRITIIQGHPDPAGHRFCHALADAYAAGAEAAALEVKRIEVGKLEFPLLRTQADFEKGSPPASIATAQEAIRWAEHLVIIYPRWLGMMPALPKGFGMMGSASERKRKAWLEKLRALGGRGQ